MYTYAIVALSERAFKKLSEQDQAIVDAQFRAASRTIDRQTRQDNLRSFAALKTLGINILDLSDMDRAALEAESVAATSLLIDRNQFSDDIYQEVMSILDAEREM
jgi:TRAP-type C4-dicarboxylate transport system substrate-binding protein